MSDSNGRPADDADLARQLAAPFDPSEVQFRAGAVSGNRALALPYIDARAVMDRLDAVVGPAHWQDDYTVLPNGAVVCRLMLRVNGEWLYKADVGAESDQPDAGDRTKAAFSDALKRAGVRWGIARYLGRLPAQWCDYDPVKKQFLKPPTLLPVAVPKPCGAEVGAKLAALAQQKGVTPAELLTVTEARALWGRLSSLPTP
jgi:hypothetical protein